ncbi:hypothetical protein FRC98_09540 [Lujinxingia vulgaris]|uniref:Bulb-type lectin domain-containing protein n=1 Tax=Lujinxingia vulgaris TaxID=2600176 RepID=A0A5C6X6T6_9DELT|nr:hypothetical protein [Lujinxingia vulgaris]TXD36974.1 hypothetical protein FRC98_09540 [Lujinxingia vulgaris]
MKFPVIALLTLGFAVASCSDDNPRRSDFLRDAGDVALQEDTPNDEAPRCIEHSDCSSVLPYCDVQSGDCVACLPGLETQHRWHHLWPGSEESHPEIALLAPHPDGGMVITGDFRPGDLTSSTTPLWGEELEHSMARLSAGGEVLWIRGLPVGLRNIAIDDSSQIYVIGRSDSQTDLGAGIPEDAVDESGFLLSFSGDGEYLWERRFTTPNLQALDAHHGEVLLAGTFAADVDLGAGPIEPQHEGATGFYALFANDGAYIDHRVPGPSYTFSVSQAALLDDNTIALSGTFRAELDLGAGEVSSGTNSDAFLVVYSRDGEHRAQTILTSPGTVSPTDVAVRPDGGLVVLYNTSGRVDVGGVFSFSPLYMYANSGGTIEPFAVSYHADGTPHWLRGLRAARHGGDVAVDTLGNTYLLGSYQLYYRQDSAEIDLGHGARELVGESDGFLAAYDPNGEPLWELFYSQQGSEIFASALAITADEQLVAAMQVTGEVETGAGPVSSASRSTLLTGLCMP